MRAQFGSFKCEDGSTENRCNYSNDFLNLPDNVSANLFEFSIPTTVDFEFSSPTIVDFEFSSPTIVDLTMQSTDSQEVVMVDRPIISDITKSDSSSPTIVDLTMQSADSQEVVMVDRQIISDNTKSDSNMGLKTSECKKHKIPEVPIPATSEDCIPCKVPKGLVPQLVCGSFAKISSSNSTITSDSQTLTNGNTHETVYLPRHTMEVNRFNKDHIDLKPVHYQVLDMFPDVEYNYLIRLCTQESDINQIVNILLETDDYPRENHAKVSNITPYLYKTDSDSEVNVQQDSNILNDRPMDVFHDCHQDQLIRKASVVSENNRLEFLISIFPDADRTFLETKSNLKDNKLEEFINEVSESRNYPKLDVKVEKKAESNDDDELGLYTTAFNIDNFLKIFPEPVKYFMDENRNCLSSAHALEFLKRRYQYQNLKVIAQNYKDLGYNMSRTCQALDNKCATRATKRSPHEIKMPLETNLGFLQEACFVEHKTEIVSYLTGKAEKKQREYELAKKNGELIECGCCYDQCIFEDCAACNEGDLFCKSCIKKSTEVRIGDGLNKFPCLLDCGAEFSLQLLQSLLDANIFSRLIKRIQLEEVRAADIEGLEVCPFCEFATIPPSGTNIFTCLNPECLKESCRKCHKVSHIPQRCEEIENDDQARARKYIEDEMTKALVRECYKCKKSFIKMEGCNKMTCTCGATMCYICREPIKDYKHFNGPGAEVKSKCPLYSTDTVLHVDAVTAVAKQALQEINTINPSLQLKHDPTKMLPAATKSTLPPGVQENPFELIQRLNQRRVQRRPNVVQRNHQARDSLDVIINNVAHGNFHHNDNVPAHQPQANRHRLDQHAFMNINRPHMPNNYGLPNQHPGADNMLRQDTVQAIQMYDDIMEHVRRGLEGNPPHQYHNQN